MRPLRVNHTPHPPIVTEGTPRRHLPATRKGTDWSMIRCGPGRRMLVCVRPGLPLDEVSLVHGVPPWKIDAGRRKPRLWRRLGWRLRAISYRVGLRRLALAGLNETCTE
jgi:hypothetical protein